MLVLVHLKKFAIEQHLPIGLFVMICFGFFVPQPGIAVGRTPVNLISVCAIFVLSGLQIQASDIRDAFKAYAAVAFGLTSILLLSPLLLFAIVLVPLEPTEFALGLALFVAMPTTVSSSVALTTTANGNAALALFFSVATNILGVFTAPLFASYIFRGTSVNSLDVGSLLLQLGLTIVLPLLAGVLLRRLSWVRSVVARYKILLKFASSALLIVIPWTMMSQSSTKLQRVAAIELLAVSALAICVHCVLFAANFFLSGLFPAIALPERKAVVICGAQKTINTTLSIVLALPPQLGDPGLLILPCLIFQFSQIIIDAVIASRWALLHDRPGHDRPGPAVGRVVDASQTLQEARAASSHASGSSENATSALALNCDAVAIDSSAVMLVDAGKAYSGPDSESDPHPLHNEIVLVEAQDVRPRQSS